ncbi:MAG TPA: oligosaccharide flippase family protein, partial [Alphaproteobacteria bacterium]|nr:oligosaccharide flippase family protein [Alphaproteobacteria bacterium]
MSKHLSRGLKGTAVVAIFTVLAVGFGYLTRVFLARLITPEEFGLFYSVFTIFMFVAIFTDMGYNQALVKHVPEYLVSNDKKSLNNLIKYVFNINIALTFLVSIIVLSLSKILSQNYLKIESSEIILLFVVILFFNNIFSMVQSLFQSYQDMYNYGLFYFLNKAVFFIGIIILAAIGYNRN